MHLVPNKTIAALFPVSLTNREIIRGGVGLQF